MPRQVPKQQSNAVEVVDVDALSDKLKRERTEDAVRFDGHDILAGIFGGTKKSKTLELMDLMEQNPALLNNADAEPPQKKSLTLEMLDKTSAVKEFVNSSKEGNEKKKKKKKKKDSKKKKKSKKAKKEKDEKYIYL
jgi:hypothetical protein